MATNIEQQWASAGLSNDLAMTPTTNTTVPGAEEGGLANKLLALENAKQSKIQLLNNTTSAKLLDTSKYEDVTITGLQDADTFKLSDGRSVRVSDSLNRYDAAEIAHPEHEDGVWNRAKNLLGLGASKSEYAESTQKRAAARMLGKEPTAITNQDMIDIGNMQQVQALADLVRSDGEERWIAPLIRGVEQTDLTSGLDIKSKFKNGGSPDEHNRALGSFTNPSTGIDVTRQLALDPNQNAFAAENVNYGFERNKDGVRVDKLDTDGYLGNLVDGAQYSAGRFAASTADTAVDAVIRGSKEIAQRVKGISEEEANNILSKEFGNKVFNDKGDWIYLDKYKEGKEYGYDDSRVQAYGKEFTGVFNDPKSTFLDKAAVVLKSPIYAPEVISTSMMDMIAAVSPVGLVAFGANLANEILADRQKIEGTSDLSLESYGIALAAGTVAATVNQLTGGMAGIKGVAANVIKDGLSKMDKPAFERLTKAVGTGILEEGTEESIQELAQIVGTKLGTKEEDEILSKDTAISTGLSAALGGGAGGFTSAVRELSSVAGEYGTEKVNEIKESKTKTANENTLDTYAKGVVEGKTDLNIQEFVQFVKDNKETVDHVKVNEIIQAYGANLESAQGKVFRPDGTVDGDVIRANPPVIEELFKYIADIDNDADADVMIDKLVAEFDDKLEMKEQLQSVRAQSKEAKMQLAQFMGVQQDIFENGFLNHKSMTDALTSGSIQDKQKFLTYEAGKVQKLSSAIETVKDRLLGLVDQNPQSIEALAYLEARNFGGNAQMTRAYEAGVIANAADLMGIERTGDAIKDGKAAREAYKKSDLAVKVKNAEEVIKAFTDARISGTDGKFTVKSHEVLSELANSMTNSNNYRTDEGYSKVLEALLTETELISKFINLDRESSKARTDLLKMYNGLKTVTKESKQKVKDELGEETKDEVSVTESKPVENTTTEIASEDEVTESTPEPKTEKVETYNEEYMAEANANAKPKIEKKGDSTKIKAISGIVDEDTEEETFKGTPAQARAAERELALTINMTGEEYRSQKTWLYTSDAILRMMYEELNGIRSEFKPLIDEKYKEKKKLETELRDAYKLIGETKKAIKDGEAHLKTLEKNKETARRDSESIKFKNIRSVIAGFMDEIVAAIENLTHKLGLLGEKRKAENSKITEIKKQLDELTKEIKSLEKKAEPLKREEAEKREDIEKQKESIAETTNIVQGTKRDLQLLNKERNRIRNAYKAGEKSRSSKRLANEGFTGFKGWNTPAKLTVNGTTIAVGNPINKVLEVSNGIAPLGVVDYKDLIEPTKNEEYRLVLKDVTEVILQPSGDSLKSYKNFITYNGDKKEYNSMAFNAPGLSLLISGERFEEQSLDKNAVLALDVAMNEWLSKDAINANEMTAKDVAKYYGMDEYEVTEEQLKEFKEFGIPLRFMAEGIGAKVIGHLGYKVTSSNVAEKKEISTRLNESLGMYVIKLAEAKGLVRVEEKTYNEIAKIMGKDLDTETVVLDGIEKIQGDVVTVPSIVFGEKAKSTGEKFFEIRKRDLGIVEQYKDVKFKRPSVANVKADIKRNKVTVAPTRLLEAKKDAMLREWHLKGIDGESVVAEMFEMKRDDVKTAMGYKSKEELEALPVTMQKAAESKNRQIATSVDSLFNLADNLKNGYEMNSLWFDYFIGKNNRLYVDSEGVNNQSDKFHRHLIYTEGQEATVIKGDKSERVFKLAVAQAFGLDVDKMSIEKTMEEADKLLASQKEIEAGWNEVKNGAREFKISGFEKAIKVKELGHLVDGIQAVRDYNEADTEFNTTLLVESDAVTSGFGLKLLQLIGNLDEGFGGETTARLWLEKVGIFVGKDGKLLGGNIVDSYKTLASNMTTPNIALAVNKAFEKESTKNKLARDLGLDTDLHSDTVIKKRAAEVTGLIVGVIGKLTDDNGEVTGVARSLFKPPFMTFMYGAGFTKIKKELAALVIDIIMEKVAKYDQGNPDKNLEKLMMDATGAKTASEAYGIFRGKDIKEYKIDNDRTVYEILEGNINASFGNTVEVTMKREFETIIATNKEVMGITNAVFGIWNRKFKDKVEKLKDKKLTLDSVDEITSSLVNDFPIIKGPLSEGISDGIAIFKTEIANNLKEMFANKYSNAGGYFSKDSKLTSKGVNHIIRIYKEAAAAAGVIPIHTLDGAVMASTVLGQDVQQVFDAIVGGISNIEGRVTDYNRNAYELSMNWNFLEEVLVLADRVLGNEENADYLNEYVEEQLAEDEKFDLGKLVVDLNEKAKANIVFKEKFKQEKSTIEHMVFNEDTSYKVNNSMEVTPESILGKLSTATMKKVNEKIKASKLDGDTLKDLFDKCK